MTPFARSRSTAPAKRLARRSRRTPGAVLAALARGTRRGAGAAARCARRRRAVGCAFHRQRRAALLRGPAGGPQSRHRRRPLLRTRRADRSRGGAEGAA